MRADNPLMTDSRQFRFAPRERVQASALAAAFALPLVAAILDTIGVS